MITLVILMSLPLASGQESHVSTSHGSNFSFNDSFSPSDPENTNCKFLSNLFCSITILILIYVALGISHKQNITSEIESRGLISSSLIQYGGYFPDFADILPSPIIPHTKMSSITNQSSKQPTTKISSTNQTELIKMVYTVGYPMIFPNRCLSNSARKSLLLKNQMI